MIWNFWMKISYMVQILTACILFLIPAKKKSWFPIRILACSIFWIFFAYPISGLLNIAGTVFQILFMGSVYGISSVLFIWINSKSDLTEAAFCGIISCGIQHIAFDFCTMLQIITVSTNRRPNLLEGILQLVIYILVYGISYHFLITKLAENGRYHASKDAIFPLATMMILIWGISVLQLSAITGFEAGLYSHIIYRLLDILCCIFVVWVQIDQKEKMKLIHELDGINAAARQMERQYRTTSETIEQINRKCHDLKHQVRMLRNSTDEKYIQDYLDEIENDVMIYDTAIDTGNKALNTVLMEKGLYCKDHKIQWSCMADGRKLSFMKIEDIYAVFGNALDNAVNAVMELEDSGKRVISVKILEQNRLLLIQIQNYYDQTLHFENGLPLTTKANTIDHGYGMKSIRYIVESYNGTMNVQAQNGIFILQMLFLLS